MKKKFFLSIVFFILTDFTYCQENFLQLHEIVGDTIDLTEKRDYYLFSEIPDSVFHFGFIKKRETQSTLVIHFLNDSIGKRALDSTEINGYISNIDKLSVYYKNKASSQEPDSININLSKSPNVLIDPLINSNINAGIKKEVDQTRRLQDDKTRQDLREQGFYIPEGHFELFTIKNKKKKK